MDACFQIGPPTWELTHKRDGHFVLTFRWESKGDANTDMREDALEALMTRIRAVGWVQCHDERKATDGATSPQ